MSWDEKEKDGETMVTFKAHTPGFTFDAPQCSYTVQPVPQEAATGSNVLPIVILVPIATGFL